ncbi:UDP-glucose 4-epimerase GalE [Viridibacillus sp. YIM B01967]|uniref:UDP-glucose 4-epimerase n=1 Tax=Viridibacillus soli TaxID=2798301 RepID=A0ABS1H2U7_9BACL|nr:UDP-glucose 4-epimerase GalE [Viridibacillus soli]MBK3493729.1 UDP-glucose 4-epimerase GalE [Viridibacillus soli]
MNILVTGGAGYIGSHVCIELLEAGHQVIIVDNFSNSHKEVLNRVQLITKKSVICHNVDICQTVELEKVFKKYEIDSVIHLAGYKSVPESIQNPLKYYINNLVATIQLVKLMEKYKVHHFVFSSSATVYGIPEQCPIPETANLKTVNPYGTTKLVIENFLYDFAQSNAHFSIVLLRYFNPVGAHESGLIGEDPLSVPNNLMPYITQVATGKRNYLSIYGNDYPTIDGTGVRDFIHVVDLAKGHVKALDNISGKYGWQVFNLGTGEGYSVLQLVTTFERVTGITIPYKMVDRRAGDVAICYADTTKAEKQLNWVAERGLEDMCRDAWRWQQNNPNGYTTINSKDKM